MGRGVNSEPTDKTGQGFNKHEPKAKKYNVFWETVYRKQSCCNGFGEYRATLSYEEYYYQYLFLIVLNLTGVEGGAIQALTYLSK